MGIASGARVPGARGWIETSRRASPALGVKFAKIKDGPTQLAFSAIKRFGQG